MKKVTFKIDSDGTLTVDAQGFKGAQCIKATEKLLEGLSVKRQSRKLKAEYNAVEQKTTATVRE